MAMEQRYENFQEGLKTVYFERFRHAASHRKEDTPYPLSWIFPVLWVNDIILYSSYIYVISWKTQYTLLSINLFLYRVKPHNRFKLPSPKGMFDAFEYFLSTSHILPNFSATSNKYGAPKNTLLFNKCPGNAKSK